MELTDAIHALAKAGVALALPQPRHLSLAQAAEVLDVKPTWVREHLAEFPNAWRLPAAGQSGELRIPISDVQALAKRRKLPKI